MAKKNIEESQEEITESTEVTENTTNTDVPEEIIEDNKKLKTPIYKKFKNNFMKGTELIEIPKTYARLCPSLDAALNGGLMSGQWIQISGAPKLGKTSLILLYCKDLQRLGYKIFYFDVESRLNTGLLNLSGIDKEKLVIINSKEDSLLTGESIVEILSEKIKDETPSVFIVDSIPALEFEGDGLGVLQKALKKFIRKYNHIVSVKGHYVIFLNHELKSIGGYGHSTYTPGGDFVTYLCSTLISLVKTKSLRSKTSPIGHELKIIIKSAPNAAPSEVPIRFLYDRGIDVDHDVYLFASQFSIIKVGGAGWTEWENEHIRVQGEDSFIKELKQKGKWEQLVQECDNAFKSLKG